MSAELLREAAALMRQRAGAATGSEWTHGPHFQRANCASVFAGKRTEGHYLAMYATPVDAEHIASWHPAVALEIAAFLDFAAAYGDQPEPQSPTVQFAHAIARAYLGRPS